MELVTVYSASTLGTNNFSIKYQTDCLNGLPINSGDSGKYSCASYTTFFRFNLAARTEAGKVSKSQPQTISNLFNNKKKNSLMLNSA